MFGKKMEKKSYRLCYIDEKNKVWFGNYDEKEIWGDDWDDRPYEVNSGEPYEEVRELVDEKKKKYKEHKVRYKTLIYESRWGEERKPSERGCYSVEEINRGIVPWIEADEYKIMAGTEYEEFIRIIEENGGKVYVPRRGRNRRI